MTGWWTSVCLNNTLTMRLDKGTGWAVIWGESLGQVRRKSNLPQLDGERRKEAWDRGKDQKREPKEGQGQLSFHSQNTVNPVPQEFFKPQEHRFPTVDVLSAGKLESEEVCLKFLLYQLSGLLGTLRPFRYWKSWSRMGSKCFLLRLQKREQVDWPRQEETFKEFGQLQLQLT